MFFNLAGAAAKLASVSDTLTKVGIKVPVEVTNGLATIVNLVSHADGLKMPSNFNASALVDSLSKDLVAIAPTITHDVANAELQHAIGLLSSAAQAESDLHDGKFATFIEFPMSFDDGADTVVVGAFRKSVASKVLEPALLAAFEASSAAAPSA